ncbi:MAG: hypothetical protein F6K50_06355 [Moorea sp. SIO3I7]|nr:hypothetical protein [Moorena sp. SIO3I7]
MLATKEQLKNIEVLPGVRIWQVISVDPELILIDKDLIGDPFDEEAFFLDIRAGLRERGAWFADGFAVSKPCENLYIASPVWDDWVCQKLIDNWCIKKKFPREPKAPKKGGRPGVSKKRRR